MTREVISHARVSITDANVSLYREAQATAAASATGEAVTRALHVQRTHQGRLADAKALQLRTAQDGTVSSTGFPRSLSHDYQVPPGLPVEAAEVYTLLEKAKLAGIPQTSVTRWLVAFCPKG